MKTKIHIELIEFTLNVELEKAVEKTQVKLIHPLIPAKMLHDLLLCNVFKKDFNYREVEELVAYSIIGSKTTLDNAMQKQ